MSTPTKGSAYPVPVDELVPQVRERAEELGRIPSQNQLMTEFRIGVSKARAVLTALRESGFTPGTSGAGGAGDTSGVGQDGRRLHAVPDQDTTQDTAQDITVDTEPAADTELVPADGSEESGTAAISNPDASASTPGPQDTQERQASVHGAPVPGDGAAGVPTGVPAVTPEQATQDAAVGTAATTVAAGAGAGSAPVPERSRRWQVVSLVLLSLPAFVAIWGGWVGLGRMTGFGDVELLPGIVDGWVIDSAITLPIGVEAYAAFALRVWLSPGTAAGGLARRFAMWSAFGALALGMGGQVAYHLMSAAGVTVAPWQITTLVACLPVAVLGSGAALAHLMHSGENHR